MNETLAKNLGVDEKKKLYKDLKIKKEIKKIIPESNKNIFVVVGFTEQTT